MVSGPSKISFYHTQNASFVSFPCTPTTAATTDFASHLNQKPKTEQKILQKSLDTTGYLPYWGHDKASCPQLNPLSMMRNQRDIPYVQSLVPLPVISSQVRVNGTGDCRNGVEIASLISRDGAGENDSKGASRKASEQALARSPRSDEMIRGLSGNAFLPLSPRVSLPRSGPPWNI